MPYCVMCGSEVKPRDVFCAQCGTRQNAPAPTSDAGESAGSASGTGSSSAFAAAPPISFKDDLRGLNPRTASILCYIPWIGWIAAIIVLAAEKFRHNRSVRFHAFQGLYLFVAWLMNAWVLRPMLSLVPHFRLHQIIDLVLLGMWIFMIVKAANEEQFSLPLFGELAQRSAAED